MSNVLKELTTTAKVLRIAIAIKAPQPGKDHMFAMLCEPSDLPSADWEKVNEYTHRTGAGRRRTDEVRRARQKGSIHAWRCLRSEELQRSVWFAITPYASPADAEASLPKFPDGLLRRPFSSVEVTDQHMVHDRTIDALPDAIIFEESSIGARGPAVTRIVAGTVSNVVVVMTFSANGGQWPWEDVMSISVTQVHRIRKQLSNDEYDGPVNQQ
jgi:hypothetical protein